MKKQQKLITQVIKVCQEDRSLYPPTYYEESCREDGSSQTSKISLLELLADGWEIKTGWGAGGGSIGINKNAITTISTPFVSFILLEKEEP